MDDTVNISGGKQLAQFLQQLPLNIERNIMRAALREGARVIADEAKRHVPVKYGNLKRSIRTGSTKQKGGVKAYVLAGGKKGKGSKDRSAFYAKFIEYGTSAHIIKAGKNKQTLIFTAKDGKKVETLQVNHPGIIARPFMRPALDSKGNEAVQAVANRIRKSLTEHGIYAPAPEGID